MNTVNTELELTELLEETVSLTGQLYSRYSEQFSDQNGFWSDLSSAKAEHISLLRSLRAKIYAGKVNSNGMRFNKRAMQTFNEYVKGLLSGLSTQESFMKHALEAACYLEWASMEQGFFKSRKKDPEELKEVLKGLATASRSARTILMKTVRKTRLSSTSLHFANPRNDAAAGKTGPLEFRGLTNLGYYPYGA